MINKFITFYLFHIHLFTHSPIYDSPCICVMFSLSLAENTTIGTVITTSVNATDGDSGLDGVVRYLLTSGDSTKFGVDSYTGAVTLLGL